MQEHAREAAHLAACADCQARESLMALDVDLDRVWSRVAGEVWLREPGPLQRLATRLLGSPGLARALVTTPSLVLSWVLASIAVLAVGVLATHVLGSPWVALLAPALAGTGIAYSYGPGVDPAFELGRTMVVSDRLILLARGMTVFGLNALLGIGASLLTANVADITWSWLVPMTTISTIGLAGATLSGSANTGVATALCGWAVIVLARMVETRDLALAAEPPVAWIPAYILLAVLGIAVSLYATSSQRLEQTRLRQTL